MTVAASEPKLLERARELVTLEELVMAAGSGRGALALVCGEAGVGKTRLVRTLCELAEGAPRILWGGCEPLFEPRPLGPFLDVAEAVGGELAELMDRPSKPHEIFVALRRGLARRRPTVLVLEDLHWADEATLDVLRLLAGRLDDVGAAVIATYRDDELDRWHPLRSLVGEIAARQRITRLRLRPLSEEAVMELAGPYDADPRELYSRTGGNPFFVTEVLAAAGADVPATVIDAVLARAARLGIAARELLEAVAICPPDAEVWLLDALVENVAESLDECISAGMLQRELGRASFRHELARAAIEASIDERRRNALHRAALAALEKPPAGDPDVIKLAHHAAALDDADAVLRFAPAAALHSSKLGAHCEAAALYARALRFAQGVPIDVRAKLFLGRAAECFLTTQFEAAVHAQRQAVECYEQLGDSARQANAMRWLSYLIWETGSLSDAQELAHEAVVKLEPLPAGRGLVSAACNVAQLWLAAEDPVQAMQWALRGAALARQVDDSSATREALRTLGYTEFFDGQSSGLGKLERCIELAEQAGAEAEVALTHTIIAETAIRNRRYDVAERHIRLGLEYCDGRDFDVYRYYLISWQAKVRLAAGRWDEAAHLAGIALWDPCPIGRQHALIALGLVRARRGDPDPWGPLDEALAVAEPRQELQWIAPVAMARAEAAWLEGRTDAALAETEAAFELARGRRTSYRVGIAYWRWRAGMEPDSPDRSEDPHALEMARQWKQAAERWEQIGCPYEAALARANADDEAPLRQAHAQLQALGARPAAAIVARKLRESGVRDIARGPRPRTRANPAGLTPRELEVIALVGDGLRNSEIAERLVLSEKTVHHHVSSILRKLDVRTRGEASVKALQLGLTPQP